MRWCKKKERALPLDKTRFVFARTRLEMQCTKCNTINDDDSVVCFNTKCLLPLSVHGLRIGSRRVATPASYTFSCTEKLDEDADPSSMKSEEDSSDHDSDSGDDGNSVAEELSAYEIQRLATIESNRKVLVELGLGGPHLTIAKASHKRFTPKRKKVTRATAISATVRQRAHTRIPLPPKQVETRVSAPAVYDAPRDSLWWMNLDIATTVTGGCRDFDVGTLSSSFQEHGTLCELFRSSSGVTWHKGGHCYQAQICFGSSFVSLGYYERKDTARFVVAVARSDARLRAPDSRYRRNCMRAFLCAMRFDEFALRWQFERIARSQETFGAAEGTDTLLISDLLTMIE